MKYKNSKNNIIACKFNNEVKSLDYEIKKDGKLETLDLTTKDGMRIYRRGLIYIVLKAFEELYKEANINVNYQLYHALFLLKLLI
jgi:uridine kinase